MRLREHPLDLPERPLADPHRLVGQRVPVPDVTLDGPLEHGNEVRRLVFGEGDGVDQHHVRHVEKTRERDLI